MADPTLTYTPQSHLTHAAMRHLVESGQTVLVPGKMTVDAQGNRFWPPSRVVNRVEDLPSEVELSRADPATQEALHRRLRTQKEAIDRQLALLDVPEAEEQGQGKPPAQAQPGMMPEKEAQAIFDEQQANHRKEKEALLAQIRDLKAQKDPAGKSAPEAGPHPSEPLGPQGGSPLPIPEPRGDGPGKDPKKK